MHYKLEEIEEELALYSIHKQYNRTRDRRHTEWRLACRGKDCRAELILHWQMGTPAGTLLSDVDRKGWLIGRGDRPLCPACQRAISRKAKELETPMVKEIETTLIRRVPDDAFAVAAATVSAKIEEEDGATIMDEMTKIEDVREASTTAPADDVQPAPKIAREVYRILDENFDEEGHRYRNGYDDDKVAAEAGCHVSVVQRVRIGAYGELVEDVRLSALRNDMIAYGKALTKYMAQATTDLDALRSRLEQLAMTARR